MDPLRAKVAYVPKNKRAPPPAAAAVRIPETTFPQPAAAEASSAATPGYYSADWASLDARPLPQWYADAKFGVFIHWGVYSVPCWAHQTGNGNGAEWYLKKLITTGRDNGATSRHHTATYGDKFKYTDFGPAFTAEAWDPVKWAKLFKEAGARYVVLTSKHHDGFCLWPATLTHPGWNAGEVGPKRDLIGELAAAVRAEGLKFGLYYSLMEWINPVYDQDAKMKTRKYATTIVNKDLHDLVTTYKPEVLWFDGDWTKDVDYWGMPNFLSWLYSSSPVAETVVVNDRLGAGCGGVHGDFFNGRDRNTAGSAGHKWECCMTIGWSWGYNQALPDSAYQSADTLIQLLTETTAKNGNLLLNVGPTKSGLIIPQETAVLQQMGKWLATKAGQTLFGSTMIGEPFMRSWVKVYQISQAGNRFALVCGEWKKVERVSIPAGAAQTFKLLCTIKGEEQEVGLTVSAPEGQFVSAELPHSLRASLADPVLVIALRP